MPENISTEIREIQHTAEHHLSRASAIVHILQALIWQVESQWHTDQPFTLHDLTPVDLRITFEILSDELEAAQAVLSELEVTARKVIDTPTGGSPCP